jgi:general secretion pathway protein L
MNFFSIQDGWNWWLAQLASLLLPRDPRKQVARLASTELHLAKSGVQLFRGARITEPLKSAQHFGTENAIEGAVRSLRKRENVIVSLDETHCFCREVTLPAGAGTRIQSILDLDVSRVTPFARSDVINAWYVVKQDVSGASSLEQIIIRKRAIEEIVSNVRKAGAKPIAIVVRKLGSAALPFVVEPDGTYYGQKYFTRWVKISLSSLAFLVLALCLFAGANLHRQTLTLAAIEDQTGIAEKGAVKVRQHVERLETASREVRALQQFRRRQHSVLEVWEELSRVLPDSAWLQSLSFTQESVTAEGLAESAEDLISLLEASPLFERVKFASPVYKNPDEKRARFTISLELAKPPQGAAP